MYPRQIRHEYIIILYQAKLTRIKVTIAVYGTNYLSRAKLMLIPAKIYGGIVVDSLLMKWLHCCCVLQVGKL